MLVLFFFKQKTAYEMRISDWSSDVCSSDLGTDVRPSTRFKRSPECVRTGIPISRSGGDGVRRTTVRHQPDPSVEIAKVAVFGKALCCYVSECVPLRSPKTVLLLGSV